MTNAKLEDAITIDHAIEMLQAAKKDFGGDTKMTIHLIVPKEELDFALTDGGIRKWTGPEEIRPTFGFDCSHETLFTEDLGSDDDEEDEEDGE